MRFLLILLLLVGCQEDVKPIKHVTPRLKQVESKVYPLSSDEHLIIIDIPDLYLDRRCAVFVNELTKSSSPLNCNFDSVGSTMPEQGED